MKLESYSHPISDIREWSDDERLELRPDFQRNEVWTKAAQIMLIDTILKGIPIPKVYTINNMSDRKEKMLELADAFIALPGGIGTLDEMEKAGLLWKKSMEHVFFSDDLRKIGDFIEQF